ncbi:hypothetical protein ABIC55_003107 [Sporosarcina psychrophila]|uniref:Uncharacterized protein n=1 Tax=Sporosarcina psychrophila TaxID=1476 RepID=A0ABV2KAB5_SPOPS
MGLSEKGQSFLFYVVACEWGVMLGVRRDMIG